MDGSASDAKSEVEPEHSLKSSIASEVEEQEAEGVAEEEDYEEEVVVVKRPVRQRASIDSYQASVRQEVAPTPSGSSYPGSPLFWVGVGVALAVAGAWIGGKVKERALKAAMQAMMSGAGNGGQPNPFGTQASSPSPFPMPGGSGPNPFANFPMPPMPPPPSKPQGNVTETTATPVQSAPKSERPEVKTAQPDTAAKAEESTPKPKKGEE